jgi:37-kD nucleoid-associated bacterial protein
MDLGTFFINSLIVHDVPRRAADGSGQAVLLSEVASDLDVDLLNFFKEKITNSLGRNAFEVEHDSVEQSPVPGLVVKIIGDKEQLVASSQVVANHLHGTQTGVNPSGLLVVCSGTVDGRDCCAILKLEREEAIRVQQTEVGGKRTFNVHHLRDLMLGRGTRIFKASLFVTGEETPGSLEGRVSDDQSAIADQSGGVANFFLRKFLGCKLKEAPDVATRMFFETSQQWINAIEDPVKRGRYEGALIAQMNHQSNSVVPSTFADGNLDSEDRRLFREHLAEHKAPTTRFIKDTRLIAPKIRQMSIRFEKSNVKVSATPQAFDEYVRINTPSGDRAPVEIFDEVRDVRGGG